jgi:hypothetical protein
MNMPTSYQTAIRTAEAASLLDEAIRRTVVRAIETGDLLDVGAEARRLAASYPWIASTSIAEMLLRAGVEARINLELATPGSSEAAERRRAKAA